MAKGSSSRHGARNQRPISPHMVQGRWRMILSTIVIAVVFVFFKQRTDKDELPHSYVLCSRDGPKIYTSDIHQPKVQCILVHGSQIGARGTLSEVLKRWPLIRGEQDPVSVPTRFIDRGSIIVPGLIDSHAHILEYGAQAQLDLQHAKSKEETIQLVSQYVESLEEKTRDPSLWIEGWGFDYTQWPDSNWPTSEDLVSDSLLRDRYIILHSKDGHALWISPKVMDTVPSWSTHIEGGAIFRKDDDSPTGVLLDSAMFLVERPALTEIELRRQFNIAVSDALANGLTLITDAAFRPMSLDLFLRIHAQEGLPIRLYAMRHFDEAAINDGTGMEMMTNWDHRLVVRSFKIFSDGALRTAGAALHEPYTDATSSLGALRMAPDVLKVVVAKYLRAGWQVNVHSIGDRANTVVLDAMEEGLIGLNASKLRPRLEHAQMMTKSDLKRVGRLGVIASIQPAHAISDMWYAEDRVGYDRAKGLYAFRSLLDGGARLAFGSDFPVETMNPITGFYAAVTRKSPDGTSPHGSDGWFKSERLSREEALRGLTIDAAYASFADEVLGSLAPGKKADYVVLDQDIMEVKESRILNTRVKATVLDGQVVFGKL